MSFLRLLLAQPVSFWIDLGARLVGLASVMLIALRWAERLFAIWIPREENPGFWRFYGKFVETFRYISLSSTAILPLLPQPKITEDKSS